MRVSTDLGGTSTVIHVHGDVDMASADELRRTLGAAAGSRQVTVDLAAVTFCDSAGLYALGDSQAAVSASGGEFSLRSPSGPVLRLLNAAGAGQQFRICPAKAGEASD